MNNEYRRRILEEGYFTEEDYPCTIKTNFSILGSIIEIARQEQKISFLPDDSIGDILGFDAVTIYEKYNLSHGPVDILSFDNVFVECDIAHGKILRG